MAGPDGQPVGGATVTLLDQLGSRVTTVDTEHDGRFRLEDVPPGTYTLFAEAPAQRSAAHVHVLAARPLPDLPVVVTVTRVAPSQGLDPHDALGPALKGCIDGVADALGLANDRDPRVTWKLDQRRGRPREYAVEVHIVGARA